MSRKLSNRMNKLVGVANLLTGISVGIFAPIITVILIIIVIPLSIAKTILSESCEIFSRSLKEVMQVAFRFSNRGLDRLYNKDKE